MLVHLWCLELFQIGFKSKLMLISFSQKCSSVWQPNCKPIEKCYCKLTVKMTNYELYYDNVQSQLSLVVVRFEIELYVKLCGFFLNCTLSIQIMIKSHNGEECHSSWMKENSNIFKC